MAVDVVRTNAVITHLVEGSTYVFYVTAWNTSNLESDPSDSVTWTVPTVAAAAAVETGNPQTTADTSYATPINTPNSLALTLTVAATRGTAGNALSFLGIGVVQPAVYQGIIGQVKGPTISDSSATWTDGQFDGSQGPHYLEITSGVNAGLTSDIIATDGATESLLLALDLSPNLSGGETYSIRPHWTLASVFGTNNEVGLGSGTLESADLILLLDPATHMFRTYFFRTAGIGHLGWSTTTDAFADCAQTTIPPGDGLLIQRKQSADLQILLNGEVDQGPTAVEFQPGINIVGNVRSVDFTLQDSDLYTDDPRTELTGGLFGSAEKVLIYSGNGYATVYYKIYGVWGKDRRTAADGWHDASGAVISAGTAFLIDRQAFWWRME